MTALAADKIISQVTPVVEITSEAPRPQNAIRRFEFADLSRHGGWMMKRLAKQFPHVSEQHIAFFLRGLVGSNEYSFLCQDHGVALAQLVRPATVVSTSIIQEWFVWVEHPSNKAHVEAGAEFYTEWKTWAGHLGIDVMIVMENTDIPAEMVEARLGTLRKKPQLFARIGR